MFSTQSVSSSRILWVALLAGTLFVHFVNALPTNQPPSVYINNQKFYIDGNEFLVKGMVYQPAPLGINSMKSDGYGGGGLCSAKLTAYNEWKSACYDYDFFDGSPSTPDRVPPGPVHWFSQLWDRDLPYLKELGVNTLRIYSANPLTLQAAQTLVDSGWNDIEFPYGKSHVEFMDACQEAGIRVLFPLAQDVHSFAADELKLLEQKFTNLLDEVGNHPALLGFVVGSDWGLESPSQETAVFKVNEMLNFSRNYLNTKFGRVVPFTYCVSDLPSAAPMYGSQLQIDFICANAGWRGPSGLVQFVGNLSSSISWASVAKQKNWPILFGEVGNADLNQTAIESDPTWFNRMWKQTLDLDSLGVVGSIYVEYNDEPYHPEEWHRELGAVTFTVSQNGINNSTEPNIFWTDDVTKKDVLFDAIKAGTLDSVPINYNMDIYAYLQRPSTSTPVPQSPSSLNQPNHSSPLHNIPMSTLFLAILLMTLLIL